MHYMYVLYLLRIAQRNLHQTVAHIMLSIYLCLLKCTKIKLTGLYKAIETFLELCLTQ